MNNEILNSIDDIISTIKNSEDYKDYIYLKEKLSKHEKANELIKEIKKKQKELVKKRVNKEDISNLDKEIDDLVKELNRIPLYVDFINKQESLNELYQVIKSRLDDYFYNKLN